jgi:[acyl-carrier-protein] S-malonyltransferase
MESAQEELKEALQAITIQSANFPVYANVTAKPVSDADEIRTLLYKQLTYPVRWTETIENMIADHANIFYEVGPGNVLSGLVKRINRDFPATAVGKADDIFTKI